MIARLTIAIPTYNRAELLRRALDSALAQTSGQVEILVSDNGSSDATPQLLAGYADRRLRCVRRDPTLSRARHGALLFQDVRTELVLLLSDDDYIEPEFAAEMIALFDSHPELSFAYSGCLEHYDDVVLPARIGPRVELPLDFIAAHYSGERQVSWCACVTRVRDLKRFGPQPEERILGDMFFWTKIAFLGPVGCVGQPLSHYTVLMPRGDNESRTTPILAWAADSRTVADEVLAGAERAGASARYLADLSAAMRRQLARSIANQFLWARVYGMSRRACVRVLPAAIVFGGWTLQGALRIAAALLFNGNTLRRMLIGRVAKMAAARAAAAAGSSGGISAAP